MHLMLMGKDPNSNPTGSPTVYRTDRDSWVVRGWVVSDTDALAQMDIPEGDIRWLPRQRISSIAIPGNDFFVLDDRLVIFLAYAGNGLGVDKVTSTDPADVQLCRSAFETVWKLAIRHSEYRPV